MPKPTKLVFLCSSCGSDFPKWLGQCPSCHEWGTLKEFHVKKSKRGSSSGHQKPSETTTLNSLLKHKPSSRIFTGIQEVDRVLGGGFLTGSLILIGGSPGVGKSTLALQIVGGSNSNTFYVSAEESEEQVALRARRLGITSSKLILSSENQIDQILEHVARLKPALVIIDSIQTVFSPDLDSLPGTVSQIRECGQQLLQICKQDGVTIVIIGHVTKEGIIAGPKMLEHMVDTVLYLDGDDRYDHRILRSVKNRFGATHEVGIFQMAADGLIEVTNPSELFLAERMTDVSGTAIYASLEGTRPILVEVQALVSNTNFGNPQRNVNGFDMRRLSMLVAVLEKRMKLILGVKDIFVNLVGGLRIDDPAADLAILSSITSSAFDKPISDDFVLAGEVGLSGEIRSVGHLGKRIVEAQALGFKHFIAPRANTQRLKSEFSGIKIHPVTSVKDVFRILFH